MNRSNALWPLLALVLCSNALAQGVRIDEGLVAEARGKLIDRMVAEHGFDRSRVTEILGRAEIRDSILEAIARPAERVVPWYEYRNIFLNDERIREGVSFWREHADLLARTAQQTGVDAEMILAIIGIESLFGQRMGRYPVLDALSTLAFAYPPRSAFFASELESFLIMSQEEGPQVLDGLGSYAGAMGAGQFIPSSYRAYAVDGDGDGRRDLWSNWDDIVASVANYLAKHGWRRDEPVAVRAARAPRFSGPEPSNKLGLDETVASLGAMGYEFGNTLPGSTAVMIVGLEQDEDSTEYWVGYPNFRVITRYNHSVKYALAAHQLGQAILAAYENEPGQTR